MRSNLKVPFAEKEAAKKLGARWDAARKVWYIEDPADLAPFARWAPSPHTPSATDAQPRKPAATRTQSTGKVIVGSEYQAQPRLCQCPPWEICGQCQATALAA